MVHSRDYHVPMHRTYPTLPAPDGSTDTSCIYHACLMHLIEIVSEEKAKVGLTLAHVCLSVLLTRFTSFSVYIQTQRMEARVLTKI